MCLVLAEASLRNAGQASDLALGDAMRAQNRDHRAEIAPFTRIEHIPPRADALHYLPEDRDVHRQSACASLEELGWLR